METLDFFIGNTGKVGIGTMSPATNLHVMGDVTVSGNIAAKYQDVAEWVKSSQKLAAGTVVIFDPVKTNQVIGSTQSYDTRVAGVISLRPGLTLGEAGEGRVLVASTGRVKVKVDATNGPINIGDLLVTSEKEGVAMKSVPVDIGGVRIHRPGTRIGKALEPIGTGNRRDPGAVESPINSTKLMQRRRRARSSCGDFLSHGVIERRYCLIISRRIASLDLA